MEVPNSVAESESSDRSQPVQRLDADGDSELVGVAMDAVDAGGVVVELGSDVVDAEVVKKKRGRPPRAQAKSPPTKMNKEEDEDVCFICFDGGSLVLCDRRGCPKAYHPSCVKRDEAFFQSKAKWNCGWHICSLCQKAAHHMCYTCTYSLCRGCIRKADYVCVRGDKGFCTVCMRTIMLIENSGQGKDETAQVDFDDKTSWEYLFKVYWVYLKGKLSLTLDELTQAKSPWKGASTIASVSRSTNVHNGENDLKNITSNITLENLEADETERRKTDEQINIVHKESVATEKLGTDDSSSMVLCKEWATKELLDFVAHMKNGDTSILSQFDVQALMLEYIKRNNLRDPRKKSQIICDLRLKNLFGKPRVGHFEMLKLLEFHFFTKDDSQKSTINGIVKQSEHDWNSDNMLMVSKDKKRRNRRKGEERTPQNKLDEYAAIDVHNMNLVYLRRNLMENLIEDTEKFHEKVVGSIVRIRISGSDQKHDMYRLVQVVGTSKVDVPYKIGNKSADFALEVLNLDKKETVLIDTISNQDLSEDECRRLRQSIRCGLVKRFTVGEIEEKAVALQSVRLNDWMGTEILRLNHLRDRASEKGHKKGLRECVEKLQLLKTPEERERRLREIPEVHSDPKMSPDYESDDAEEPFNKEPGEHTSRKLSGLGGKFTSSPRKRAENSNDPGSRSRGKVQRRHTSVTTYPNLEEGSKKATKRMDTKKDSFILSSSGRPQKEANCNGSTITNIASERRNIPSTGDGEIDKVWHYRDPNGKVQGPFCMLQLQKWSTTGYFPPDMRIWVSQEHESLLLNDVLKEQSHNNNDVRWSENTTATAKVGLTVCTAIPSSTVRSTPNGPDSVNHEKLYIRNGSTGQSSGQNWNANNSPMNVDSLAKPNESTEQFNAADADIKHISSVFTVEDVALVDLPSPTPKKTSHEEEKVQVVDDNDKEQSVQPSKVTVQETANPPSWSSASSQVVNGAQLPETADEWGGYSPTPVKREEWDAGHLAVSPLMVGDNVATPTSNIEQMIHSSSPPPSQVVYNNDMPSWDGVRETIEFSTLAEESVSDLLAEVDAMESRNGLPSPTSRRNIFVEDLFNGSFEEFSPTPDQGTRSDGFSSSADIQFPCQSTTTDDHGVRASQGNNTIVFDLANYPINNSIKAGTNDSGREDDKMLQSTSVEAEAAGRKLGGGVENGQYIQTEVAPPPPPPPPPPAFDPFDQRRVGAGGGWDPHQQRYGGERYNIVTTTTTNNNTPRERSYQIGDSGYNRGGRTSWGRQSSFGTGTGNGIGGGVGGGYLRPAAKGQRVCKFYESGRCKKGASCNYLHP